MFLTKIKFIFHQLASFNSILFFCISRYKDFKKNLYSPNVAILVTPWYGSDVPWLSISIALLLVPKGNNVILISENLSIDPNFSWSEKIQFFLVELALVVINFSGLKVINIKGSNISANNIYPNSIKHAKKYSTWLLRGEAKVSDSIISYLSQKYNSNYYSIQSSCSTLNPDVILIPGGLCKNTPLWIDYCKTRDIRFATFDDGGVGKLMFSSSGIASQNHDVPFLVSQLSDRSSFSTLTLNSITSQVESEISARSAGLMGSDGTISQQYPASGLQKQIGVLICLNSIWDSAALGLHTCFDDTLSWLKLSIEHILKYSNLDITIRQHPHEKYVFARGSDDIRSLLNDWFGINNRIFFEDCFSSVNTYDLIKNCSFVLVHSSTVGLEASFLGKPVITQASSYYSSIGCVFFTPSPDLYWKKINLAIDGLLNVSQQMKTAACLAYYVSQKFCFIQTLLSPSSSSLNTGIPFANLEQEHSCSLILHSLVTNESFQELSLLNEFKSISAN